MTHARYSVQSMRMVCDGAQFAPGCLTAQHARQSCVLQACERFGMFRYYYTTYHAIVCTTMLNAFACLYYQMGMLHTCVIPMMWELQSPTYCMQYLTWCMILMHWWHNGLRWRCCRTRIGCLLHHLEFASVATSAQVVVVIFVSCVGWAANWRRPQGFPTHSRIHSRTCITAIHVSMVVSDFRLHVDRWPCFA